MYMYSAHIITVKLLTSTWYLIELSTLEAVLNETE